MINLDLGPYSECLSFRSPSYVWSTYMRDRTKLRFNTLLGEWVVVGVSRHVDEDVYRVVVKRVG